MTRPRWRCETECATAAGTAIALPCESDIREPPVEVPAVLDAAEVVARPVRAGHELSLPKRLVDDDLAGKADGPERAGLGAERRDDLVDLCGSDTSPPSTEASFAFVQPVVAADEREHDLAVRDDRHRLRRCRQVDAEEVGEGLARLDTGRLDLGRRVQPLGERRRARHPVRDLEVGGVVAALARDERVFARAGRREVVERLAAAHHPGLRLDADDVESAALEDPLIGPGVRTERNIEPFLVPVERVGVLHHELAHPQEPAARPGLVPPFRLEVVEDSSAGRGTSAARARGT